MEERAAVCPGIKAGQKNCHNKKEVLSNVGQKDIKKDQAPKRPQKVSGQALKICGMTLICLGVMFAVAWVNRNRQENRLAEEYTISAENPRHIRFEEMPEGEAEMTAGLFFRYHAMAQYEECSSLLSKDQAEFMNFPQQEEDFKSGSYIKDYLIHSFETLPEEEYAGSKEYYDGRAALLGYEEYRVVRVAFHHAKITAGSSTRTPMSTRLDFVGILRSLQTFSIHLLPLRPTETIPVSYTHLDVYKRQAFVLLFTVSSVSLKYCLLSL